MDPILLKIEGKDYSMSDARELYEALKEIFEPQLMRFPKMPSDLYPNPVPPSPITPIPTIGDTPEMPNFTYTGSGHTVDRPCTIPVKTADPGDQGEAVEMMDRLDESPIENCCPANHDYAAGTNHAKIPAPSIPRIVRQGEDEIES